jgi:hypothetical protein
MPDYLLDCGVHTLHMPVSAPDAEGEAVRAATAKRLPCRVCLVPRGFAVTVGAAVADGKKRKR